MIIDKLLDIYTSCRLCPRACRVDRTKGETGYCGLTTEIVLDSAFPHHGEEAPLSGSSGSGTIFLSSCNLGCIYCQNYQISHSVRGEKCTPAELARIMLDLEKRGCHNIGPVTPTPQAPSVMQALTMARSQNLTVPFIYNCGGYENPEVIRMLDGMVDIYLPDFKYALEEDALDFSSAPGYPQFALASIKEMVSQVGDSLIMEKGVAKRGIIVRHLILPGRLENSKKALLLLKEKVSARIPVSLMGQYWPTPRVSNHPLIVRRLRPEEYQQILDYALALGFENLFIQELW